MHNIPAFIAKIFTLPDVDLEEIVNNYIKVYSVNEITV